jgi:asparagine synthase (glutamine-hydrolysing)
MIWGKWVIVFNGEIYNYKQIQLLLEKKGYVFTTSSDTEVIIKSFDCWGKDAVKYFRGMFAFALWDKESKKLLLCRDRVGVKPLFWYFKDNLFLFASEIKAFHEHPLFDKTIDLESLPFYFQHGYFNERQCIYKYVNKVPPGCFLEIDSTKNLIIDKYWSVSEVYCNAIIDQRSDIEIQDQLESILTESFQLRMIADVEVGVFLSGGIDSSLVTALIQKDNSRPLQTFTIGFEDKIFDEAEIASKVASCLGTTHSTLICTEKDFKEVIPDLSNIYDEPFGDSSAIPTYLVSKLARQNVKVALSGDGGDELFGGYSKYLFAKHSSFLLSIPFPLRQLLYRASFLCTPNVIESLASQLRFSTYTQIGSKYLKFQQTLLAKNKLDFFKKSSSYLSDSTLQKLTGRVVTNTSDNDCHFRGDLISFLGMHDIKCYLPSDILAKVDRASMSVALEAREPFLDPEIINFAFSLPDRLKISDRGESKSILRKILSKYIPVNLIDRPKQGFTIPIEQWLQGFLKDELHQMANDKNFFEVFGINQAHFKTILHTFLSRKGRHNPHFIWFVYCLYKWYERWL